MVFFADPPASSFFHSLPPFAASFILPQVDKQATSPKEQRAADDSGFQQSTLSPTYNNNFGKNVSSQEGPSNIDGWGNISPNQSSIQPLSQDPWGDAVQGGTETAPPQPSTNVWGEEAPPPLSNPPPAGWSSSLPVVSSDIWGDELSLDAVSSSTMNSTTIIQNETSDKMRTQATEINPWGNSDTSAAAGKSNITKEGLSMDSNAPSTSVWGDIGDIASQKAAITNDNSAWGEGDHTTDTSFVNNAAPTTAGADSWGQASDTRSYNNFSKDSHERGERGPGGGRGRGRSDVRGRGRDRGRGRGGAYTSPAGGSHQGNYQERSHGHNQSYQDPNQGWRSRNQRSHPYPFIKSPPSAASNQDQTQTKTTHGGLSGSYNYSYDYSIPQIATESLQQYGTVNQIPRKLPASSLIRIPQMAADLINDAPKQTGTGACGHTSVITQDQVPNEPCTIDPWA